MKNIICLFLILTTAAAIVSGQKAFEVRDFSKDYYGKVYFEKPSEAYSAGWIGIFEKKTNRQLIKLNAELDSDMFEGKIKTDPAKIAYDEQNLIIYDDFNFDGVKDFAVKDGQNGCYGEASYKIYLAGRAGGSFAFSPSFTRLAQDYCGMFDVDAKEKKIKTTLKSGVGWHQSSEFIVVGNAPKAVKIYEERWDFPFNTTTTETRNGKKMVKNVLRTPAFQEGDVKILLSFKTVRDGNEIVLYSYKDELNYMFVDKSGNVSFAYPFDAGQETARFTLDSKENPTALSFTNKNATYKIYETTDGKIGVEVDANGKLTGISGDSSSKKGSLRRLSGEKLTNVTFK